MKCRTKFELFIVFFILFINLLGGDTKFETDLFVFINYMGAGMAILTECNIL